MSHYTPRGEADKGEKQPKGYQAALEFSQTLNRFIASCWPKDLYLHEFFLGRAHSGSAIPSEVPTGQFVRSFLMFRLGQAI